MLIFVKTRWPYDSYTDFWKLVELSGFPTCFVDEMDLYNKENTYIVTPINGEWRPHIDERRDRTATIATWSLERPGDDTISNFIQGNADFVEAGYADFVIVSDRLLAMSHSCFKYVTLGSHADLGEVGSYDEKVYDIIHLSCYSNRRSFLFSQPDTIKKQFGNLLVAPNGWGITRHNSLRKSRIMMNVHQDSHMLLEPLRFALAAAYGLPLLSEYIDDPFPYESFGMYVSIDRLYPTALLMLKDYNAWWFIGQTMRDVMTKEYSFKNCVEVQL